MNDKRLITIMIAVIFIGVLTSRACRKGVSLGEIMDNTAEEINQNCPKILSEYLRLDSATADSGLQLSYYYTLMSHSGEDMNVAAFKSALKSEWIAGAIDNDDVKDFMKYNITIRMWYADKFGNPLFDFSVKPEDLRGD